MKTSQKIWILSSYGFAHMVVDFICASTVMTIYAKWLLDSQWIFFAILIYNILAFGLQTLFGALTDKFQCPKFVALLGCGLVALWTIMLLFCPWCATILVWIGNALFHVWGGVICIWVNPEKATPSGIFVAPWAFGLLMGIMLWKSWNFVWWYWVALLAISAVSMSLSSKNMNVYNIVNQFAKEQKSNFKMWVAVIAILLLLSIIIRSFVWFIVSYPRKVWTLVIIFTICIVLWKALWGVLADRFGWKKVWVISLLVSLPCLLFGSQSIVCGMIGIFLFNITMPIALIALIKAMPKRWWLAFGLLCLALLIWALPSLIWINFSEITNVLLIVLILISSLVLYFALDWLWVEE